MDSLRKERLGLHRYRIQHGIKHSVSLYSSFQRVSYYLQVYLCSKFVFAVASGRPAPSSVFPPRLIRVSVPVAVEVSGTVSVLLPMSSLAISSPIAVIFFPAHPLIVPATMAPAMSLTRVPPPVPARTLFFILPACANRGLVPSVSAFPFGMAAAIPIAFAVAFAVAFLAPIPPGPMRAVMMMALLALPVALLGPVLLLQQRLLHLFLLLLH